MQLASIVENYYDAYVKKYADTALPSHLNALNAIRRCRTPDAGEFYAHCPDCHHGQWLPLSCGHRSCPRCQNHEATQWITRQQKKLLPVHYFMLLQHVLPKGFRRVRDYGFLHANAKKLLVLVQLILHVCTTVLSQRPRPTIPCPHCQAPMEIRAFRKAAWESG